MDTKNIMRFENGDIVWFNRWRDTAPVWFCLVTLLLLFTVPPLGFILVGYDIANYWECLPEDQQG